VVTEVGGLVEVWILEAAWNHDVSYIVCVFDHKPTKKEQDEAITASSYFKGADEYTVSKYPVKGKKK
jgi:hypothetical protein